MALVSSSCQLSYAKIEVGEQMKAPEIGEDMNFRSKGFPDRNGSHDSSQLDHIAGKKTNKNVYRQSRVEATQKNYGSRILITS